MFSREEENIFRINTSDPNVQFSVEVESNLVLRKTIFLLQHLTWKAHRLNFNSQIFGKFNDCEAIPPDKIERGDKT